MMLQRAEASFFYAASLLQSGTYKLLALCVSCNAKLPRQFLENLFSSTLTANGHGCTCHKVVLLLLE